MKKINMSRDKRLKIEREKQIERESKRGGKETEKEGCGGM